MAIPSTLSSISPVINSKVSSLSFRIYQTRPFLPPSGANPSSPHRRRLLLSSQALSPQPPPQTDPPPENGSNRLKGVAVSMSRLQDRVQIFLAVLFWMSLFFWASVWDKRNTGRARHEGRPFLKLYLATKKIIIQALQGNSLQITKESRPLVTPHSNKLEPKKHVGDQENEQEPSSTIQKLFSSSGLGERVVKKDDEDERCILQTLVDSGVGRQGGGRRFGGGGAMVVMDQTCSGVIVLMNITRNGLK
ncbi:hypothetical protein K2173_024458 [Erythroxylum novogranatense]|uniref:Uncharacterized protein n=1 Tax=Erythroxylum novogranatense TaxID=1862640 RepID=A0AAV8SVF5_9ROSI|nr:hypothetical protein K2173_024458 [Erythroxylum novogranatense]